MSNEIINRVTNSSLEVFDLEDYFPKTDILFLDIKQWLFEEIILKEKDFRKTLKNHNWQNYRGKYIAIGCTSDAIIPSWAYMLVASYLIPFSLKTIKGTTDDLLLAIYQEELSKIDYSYLENKSVIIKGCSRKNVPEAAYVLATSYIQPIAKSVMYGEACSAVPIFKKK